MVIDPIVRQDAPVVRVDGSLEKALRVLKGRVGRANIEQSSLRDRRQNPSRPLRLKAKRSKAARRRELAAARKGK